MNYITSIATQPDLRRCNDMVFQFSKLKSFDMHSFIDYYDDQEEEEINPNGDLIIENKKKQEGSGYMNNLMKDKENVQQQR